MLTVVNSRGRVRAAVSACRWSKKMANCLSSFVMVVAEIEQSHNKMFSLRIKWTYNVGNSGSAMNESNVLMKRAARLADFVEAFKPRFNYVRCFIVAPHGGLAVFIASRFAIAARSGP